jgi:hypothetical protein
MPNPSTIAAAEEIETPKPPSLHGHYAYTETGDTQALKKSLLLLAADLKTAQEGRDRVLAENCTMTQQIRDLKRVAEAAERYFLAVLHDSIDTTGWTDTEVHEVAEAHAQLEAKLEALGYLKNNPRV